MLVALFFLRDRDFGSTGFLLGALALPSILGMNAAMGMVSMSQQLTADREDGTLLRAKATPNGMLGYLVGKVVSVAGGLLADLAILLIPGLFIVDGLALGSARWLDAGLGAAARAGRDVADRRDPGLGLHQRPGARADPVADARR